ncbi:MAG: cystathionine gamma-synthase [Rhodospirillaceae bacterium]|nr:cystathionine gamma-synthase [Rhodospirillaceae bacterium]|tara:strand:- start:857 stop:2080 length:1224 start_codon:yes stop_codon:yes gene_type:complete
MSSPKHTNKPPFDTIVRRSDIPQSASRPVATPLFPSVVYSSPSADTLDAQYEGIVNGYTYAREGHPNADILASKIDSLEAMASDGDVPGGIVTSSGMGAISAMFLGLLKQGDQVLAGDQLYGRSLRMLSQDLPRLGFETGFFDACDAASLEAAIQPHTRMVIIEAVSNPTLRVADVTGIAALAERYNLILVVDNTFTTPAVLRPFDHGADIIIHSVTKFLAGHSDVTLGYVAARDLAHRTAIYDAAVTWGMTPSPFDCWLAERGMHSFEVRFAAAQANAAAIADGLAGLPGMRQVLYPGRADHPDHVLAASLFDGAFGNMVSFEIEGGRAEVNRFIEAAGQIPFAPTLGDVATTLSHPASSSHRALSADARATLGMSEGFFRLSVGIEPAALLLGELQAALAAIKGT